MNQDDVSRLAQGALETLFHDLSSVQWSPWQKLAVLSKWTDSELAHSLESTRPDIQTLQWLVERVRTELCEKYALLEGPFEQSLTQTWSHICDAIAHILRSGPHDLPIERIRATATQLFADAREFLIPVRDTLRFGSYDPLHLDLCLAVAPAHYCFLTSSHATTRHSFLYFGREWLSNAQTRTAIAQLYLQDFLDLKSRYENVMTLCFVRKTMGTAEGPILLRSTIAKMLQENSIDASLSLYDELDRALYGIPSSTQQGLVFLLDRVETGASARNMIQTARENGCQAWIRVIEDSRPSPELLAEEALQTTSAVKGIANVGSLANEVEARMGWRTQEQADLRNHIPNTTIMGGGMGERDISDWLSSRHYSPDAIRACLDINPHTTLECMYEATKAGVLDIENEQAREAWRELLRSLSASGSQELLYEAESRLYESIMPEDKVLDALDVGESLAYAAAFLSLGQPGVADRVRKWYERRSHSRLVRRKLGRY